MKNLELAFGHGTPLKAFITAILVGTILTAINHGDQIINGEFPHFAKNSNDIYCPLCCDNLGFYNR